MRRCCLLVIAFIVLSVMAGCSGSWKIDPTPPPTGDDPAIRITKVEWQKGPFGNITSIHAYGKAYNVPFDKYTVCLFIHVPGAGWWPKPTWAHPFTQLGSGGAFSNHLVTGGNDEDLDAVCALLVKKDTYRPTGGGYYNPPEVNPARGIVASDTVWKPEKQTNHIDSAGVEHCFIEPSG
jgi:hypothetical protein